MTLRELFGSWCFVAFACAGAWGFAENWLCVAYGQGTVQYPIGLVVAVGACAAEIVVVFFSCDERC